MNLSLFQHINDICFAINLDESLKKAEGIFEQLKLCKKTPSHVKEIIGLEVMPIPKSSSMPNTFAWEGSPRLDLPIHMRDNNASAPSSGSGTAVTTPEDSSIEILPENTEQSVTLVCN